MGKRIDVKNRKKCHRNKLRWVAMMMVKLGQDLMGIDQRNRSEVTDQSEWREGKLTPIRASRELKQEPKLLRNKVREGEMGGGEMRENECLG